ncbi:MAG TPA: hypothetical protein DEG43_11100, partial [Acidimicrobiaceae bacterium]|nr:hypothetical protein [Acidimicrobiaceae bacterium]
MSVLPRDRIIDAVIACVDESGLGSFALEGVADKAGCSRATIYRHFPGGRDQLMAESVTREVGRFWARLAEHVAAFDQLEDRLLFGLIEARRLIETDDRLQRLVQSESDVFLPLLVASEQLVFEVLTGYLNTLLEGVTLRPGVNRSDAADYLARMFLSYVSTGGQWQLNNPEAVRRLIRT